MILPTLGFLINLAQAGLPTALFTLTSHSNYSHQQLFKSCIKIASIQLLVCLLIFHLFKSYFKNIDLYSLYIIVFIVISTLSSLLRSYHLGIQQPLRTSIAQIIEEIVRISIICFVYFKTKNISIHLLFISMVFGELSGCIYLLAHFHPHNKKITTTNLYQQVLSISIPTSISQIIHSFTHFLEPVLYKNLLLKQHFTLDDIHHSYGMISGQVFSLLMIPTFLNNVVYKLTLPKIDLHNKKRTQQLIIQSIIICLLIGLPFSLLFYFFPDIFLSFLYKNTQGAKYLKYIAFPFMIFYIQTPLQAYLQAHMKNKVLFINSIIESVSSVMLLVICIPTFKEISLLISYLDSLILYTLCCFIYVFYDLFFHKK